jgi:glycogen synthase
MMRAFSDMIFKLLKAYCSEQHIRIIYVSTTVLSIHNFSKRGGIFQHVFFFNFTWKFNYDFFGTRFFFWFMKNKVKIVVVMVMFFMVLILDSFICVIQPREYVSFLYNEYQWFCVMPVNKDGDDSSDIQHVLLKAYCSEQHIRIIYVSTTVLSIHNFSKRGDTKHHSVRVPTAIH